MFFRETENDNTNLAIHHENMPAERRTIIMGLHPDSVPFSETEVGELSSKLRLGRNLIA